MDVKNFPLADLKPYEKNPRKNDNAVDAVANSIKQFGFKVPIVIDADNVIICGHTRYKAAKALGLESVPCVIADDLTPEQVKTFRLIDNKTSELATWDFELLKEELSGVSVDLSDFGFDNLLNMNPTSSGDVKGPTGKRGTLASKFLFPPFSVLNTVKKEWQDRKKFWITDVGIRSSETREGIKTLGGVVGSTPRYYDFKERCERKLGRVLTNKEFEENYLQDYLPKDSIIANANDGGILSIFDPVLAELMYYWFCPPNGSILDPFAGGNVRGVVAALTNHEYTGVDIRQEQIDSNILSAEKLIGDAPKPRWICGDSSNISNIVAGEYDMIFSCPPYFDIEQYSDNPADLSNMTYEKFLESYRSIVNQCADMLKDNRFAVFVVGDVRDQKTGMFRNFVSETIAAFTAAGLHLYNEIILVTQAGSLPLRASRNFSTARKVGKRHQNILVFYKAFKKAREVVKNHQNVLVFYKGNNQKNISSAFGEAQIPLNSDNEELYICESDFYGSCD